jgi:hypothetical protein
MNDYLVVGVMLLLAIFGVVALCEKPKFEGAARWRYISIVIVAMGEVACLLLTLGIFSLLFGGC